MSACLWVPGVDGTDKTFSYELTATTSDGSVFNDAEYNVKAVFSPAE